MARRDTTPAESLSLKEALRFGWTQLTSMRTALTLLFVGALAAIPGSLIPQRPVSPIQVRDFMVQHPNLGWVYDKVGLFEVYTSPWFSAIYLLLLVSLIGCIIPRIGVYAKAARAEPVATPRNLLRLPVSGRAYARDDALDRAEAFLRGRRFRVRRLDEGDGVASVSAERGYLREAGNLVFHVSLVTLLLGIATGVLLGYRGTSVVLVGQGFSNTLSQYDDISSGASFTDRDLEPFTVLVDRFTVRFETSRVNTGAPREFTANVRVVEKPGAAPRAGTIEVNHPLELGATQVHLLGHGYAPRMTVRDGAGQVAWSGPSIFLPQDGNFTSAGVVNAVDARPERIALEGFFLPTATVDQRGPRSLFPDAFNPELFLTAYHGPPLVETGVPENVYSLNKQGLTQFQRDGQPLRIRMKPGETLDLPDGRGSVTFDGYERWVKLQISHTPGLWLVLGSLVVGVTGLCLSLFVRPRRVWVRVRPGDAVDGTGVRMVEVAGLDRADARAGLDDEVEALAAEVARDDVAIGADVGDDRRTGSAEGERA
ncbi:cytochrome c biogenesis protein ResB [Mariniluteicoccus flavus]